MDRSTFRRLTRAAVLVASLGIAVSKPGVGHAVGNYFLDCGHCAERTFNGNREHAFTGSCQGGGADCNYCNTPNDGFGCHVVWKIGECSEYHDSCPSFFASTLQELEKAVDAGDQVQLATLLADHRNQVFLNPDRRAIQALDCKGQVTASFIVSDTLLERLSARAD
jgi:hypothetical protein